MKGSMGCTPDGHSSPGEVFAQPLEKERHDNPWRKPFTFGVGLMVDRTTRERMTFLRAFCAPNSTPRDSGLDNERLHMTARCARRR
jgi:hypothetical protein